MPVPRWQIYEKRQQNKRERWYCDVGPTSAEWMAWSDQQRGSSAGSNTIDVDGHCGRWVGVGHLCSKCGKRGGSCGIYWYKFMWQGKLVRESTKQGTDKIARQMEAAHRTALAKGEVGIREKKPAPTLVEFCEKRFEPWIKTTTAEKTWLDFYRVGVRAIKAFRPLATLKLDELTSEISADFAAHRRAQNGGLEVSTVNSSLRVLRRVLRQAAEWGIINAVPKIKMLPGELHRERVLSTEEGPATWQ